MQSRKDSKLTSELLDHWGTLCKVVCHRDQPQSPIIDMFHQKPCCYFGVCVCHGSREGCPDAVFFHDKLVKSMKMFMSAKNKVKPRLRKLLEDALLVCQLQEVGGVEASLFFVVGHANFSTWRFSLVQLELVAVEEEENMITLQIPALADNHSVRTSVQFFAENITFDSSWKIQYWTILNDNAVVMSSDMRADLVEAQKDLELDAVQFWSGSEEERQRRKEKESKKRKPHSGSSAPKPKSGSTTQKRRRVKAGNERDEDGVDNLFPLQDEIEEHPGSGEDEDEDRESNVSQVLFSGSDLEGELSPPSTLSAASLFGNNEGDLHDFGIEEPEQVANTDGDRDIDIEDKSKRAAPVFEHDARQSEYIFTLTGHGEIRYSFTNFYMRAYCLKHGRQCTRQRTVIPSRSGVAGRPVGHLTAWLRQADQFGGAKDHMKAPAASLELRQGAREYLLSSFEGREFASRFEEQLKPGEPEEPHRSR